jgi:hypothetical protein
MRTSTAYFAGAGTVAAAIVLGLGGGLLFSNIVSPHAPRTEMSRLELHMAGKAVSASSAPSEPVPSLATTQATTSAANVQPAAAPVPPAETVAANSSPPSDATPVIHAAQPSPREQVAAPENAFAKARDADVKRVTETRKAERRQRWTERRRHLQRPDQELRDVEAKVREATEPPRAFAAEPVRFDIPRIQLFDTQ